MQREYKEYIEREEAKELVRIWISDCVLDGDNDAADCYRDCIDLLDSIPAADVAEVRHGRWIQPHWKNSNYCCNCSECGREAMHTDYQWDKNGIYPLCPNCGAYMMGENNGKCE